MAVHCCRLAKRGRSTTIRNFSCQNVSAAQSPHEEAATTSTGTISVPSFWDAEGWVCDRGIYSRQVAVPPSFGGEGTVAYLRFASVEQVARVYADGVLCAENVGGGLAFETKTSGEGCPIRPGATFELRVEVSAGSLPPIVPANVGGKRCSDLSQKDCAGPPHDRNNCTWDNG